MVKHVKWKGIIGRFIDINSIAHFVTPHGSVIKMGSYWVSQGICELNETERCSAVDLIKDARSRKEK
jgi:hypothetical protein